jgi:hypothetical protein
MRTFLIVVLLFTCAQLRAQVNLVENPSLEQYRHCPIGDDQIKLAYFWSPIDTNWYTITGDSTGWGYCSAEYCNSCATPFLSVPNGLRYNHYPRSGNGMAQVMMYYNDTDANPYKRDYLQGRLRSPLVAGQSYCVSFYVTLEQSSTFGINNIGAYLDDGTIDTAMNTCGQVQSQYIPQILDTGIINDTLNWVKIQGTYIGTGSERFITIGNFTDMFHTHYVPGIGRDTTGWGDYHNPCACYTWYLVDDVSIIKTESVANAGPDKIILLGCLDSVRIGDTLDSYLPVYWYRNGIKIDSNKASIKVHPDTTSKYVVSLDICGHVTFDTVIVQVLDTSIHHHEGIDELAKRMGSINISPNPATGYFTINNAANCEFVLRDIVGKIVYTIMVPSNAQTVPIDDIVPGIYIGQLVEPITGGRKNIRIVKQ